MEHFNIFSNINVNEYTETRDDLTYLSWSKAWEYVKAKYPDAQYTIKKFNNDLPYVYDEHTGYMVFTDMTIEGVTHEMWLPVMNSSNKAMKAEPYTYTTKKGERTVEAATMFDINKTIMRCLTKNIAMFGLGLYIYNGEDLPNSEKIIDKFVPLDDVKKSVLLKEMERTGVSEKKLFYNLGVKRWEDMSITEFKRAMDMFNVTPDKAV